MIKLSEAAKIINDYEDLIEYLNREVNDLVKLGLVEKSPFFHGCWGFGSFHFEDNIITFVDDDWWHGGDLHDYTYITVPLALFMENNNEDNRRTD